MSRTCYLTPAELLRLDAACNAIVESFRDQGDKPWGCYLVGSAMTRADYRDVDVRLILPDQIFRRFTLANARVHRLLNVALSHVEAGWVRYERWDDPLPPAQQAAPTFPEAVLVRAWTFGTRPTSGVQVWHSRSKPSLPDWKSSIEPTSGSHERNSTPRAGSRRARRGHLPHLLCAHLERGRHHRRPPARRGLVRPHRTRRRLPRVFLRHRLPPRPSDGSRGRDLRPRLRARRRRAVVMAAPVDFYPTRPWPVAVGEPHEVTQTIVFDPELNMRGIYGNCMQAAVASLLGMPLEAVPHFVTFDDWQSAMRLWLAGVDLVWRVEAISEIPDVPCLVAGRNPDDIPHVIAVLGPGHVWDPNPRRRGLSTVEEAWYFDPRPTEQEPTHG